MTNMKNISYQISTFIAGVISSNGAQLVEISPHPQSYLTWERRVLNNQLLESLIMSISSSQVNPP